MKKHSGYLPNYRKCIICGSRAHNPVSMEVKFYWDGEKIDTLVKLSERYMGFEGIVHGGIQTALLDEAMGWAITMEVGTFVLTRKITVEFIRPVKTGRMYRLLARALEHQKRISRAEGELMHVDTGKTLARAHGLFFHMNEDQARRVNDYLIYSPGDLTIFNHS